MSTKVRGMKLHETGDELTGSRVTSGLTKKATKLRPMKSERKVTGCERRPTPRMDRCVLTTICTSESGKFRSVSKPIQNRRCAQMTQSNIVRKPITLVGVACYRRVCASILSTGVITEPSLVRQERPHAQVIYSKEGGSPGKHELQVGH